MTTAVRTDVAQLLSSASPEDRRQGVLLLVRERSPDAVAVLERLTEEDPAPQIRYLARRALTAGERQAIRADLRPQAPRPRGGAARWPGPGSIARASARAAGSGRDAAEAVAERSPRSTRSAHWIAPLIVHLMPLLASVAW